MLVPIFEQDYDDPVNPNIVLHLTVFVKFKYKAGAYISIYPPDEYEALDSIES